MIKYSIKQRKIITVLMIINTFAFLVNFFNTQRYLSSNFKRENFIFTDCTPGYYKNYYWYNNKTYYYINKQEKFWPFTEFFEGYSDKRFRGIFVDYDHTEFIIYTILIFGIPVIGRVLNQTEEKNKTEL